MGGHLLMSEKERVRLKELERVRRGLINLRDAAVILNLSYRQVRRIYRRYKASGDVGLLHQSRGRLSNRRINDKVKGEILSLYQSKYHDFGAVFAAEKLAENGFTVDHETLRRWLIDAGLWQRRRKRSSQHRSWRERRAHFGELVQLDGSPHDWFEGRSEKCCLLNMVDDATGKTMSIFSPQETAETAMKLLWQWILQYGIPVALYTDRSNIYIAKREPSMEEKLKGDLPLTQFGCACKKLGINIIAANSPQAKGRVERSHSVYQDRLVKELRLNGINDIAAANEFLAGGYLEKLNRRFAKPAREAADYHRVLDAGLDLKSVFCFQEQRSIGNDWTVRYNNRFFQIKKQSNLPPTKNKVVVQEHLDGTLHLVYRDISLEFVELPERPKETFIVTKQEIEKYGQKYITPKNHPWRRLFWYVKPKEQVDISNELK